MGKFYSREEIYKANGVDITQLLTKNGVKVKKVGGYFTTEIHDSIRIKGCSFVWYSRGISSHTIDFVKEFYNLSFCDAMEFIFSNEPRLIDVKDCKDSHSKSNIKVLEEIHENYNEKNAIAYLCRKRGISYKTVKLLLDKGILKQDEHKNIVFKALDDKGKVVGGEIRSSQDYAKYRRVLGGSASGYGVNLCLGKPEKAYFFESAIDMISFYELYNESLKDCVLMSMGGLKDIVIDTTIQRYGLKYEDAYLCVDNDEAGCNFVKKIKEKHNEIESITLELVKDWNEALLEKQSNKKRCSKEIEAAENFV